MHTHLQPPISSFISTYISYTHIYLYLSIKGRSPYRRQSEWASTSKGTRSLMISSSRWRPKPPSHSLAIRSKSGRGDQITWSSHPSFRDKGRGRRGEEEVKPWRHIRTPCSKYNIVYISEKNWARRERGESPIKKIWLSKFKKSHAFKKAPEGSSIARRERDGDSSSVLSIYLSIAFWPLINDFEIKISLSEELPFLFSSLPSSSLKVNYKRSSNTNN